MTKVFIDGKEGTTGLKIFERISLYEDISLLTLKDKYRKDISARKDMINQSDITFICLPDDAALEAVTLRQNDKTKIIDASSAHRTHPSWDYGFPELSDKHHQNIKTSRNVSVPGCHASGFLAIVYPLVTRGIMPNNYPISCHSLTGYSGGGKKMIKEFEEDTTIQPFQYALTKEHKHLKEMQGVAALSDMPLFTPIVCNFYSGMQVTISLYSHLLKGNPHAKEICEMLQKYYMGQKMIKVMPFVEDISTRLSATLLKNSNSMEIYVSGTDKRINIVAQYDNLGKGASGAALQCMNLMLGLPEDHNL